MLNQIKLFFDQHIALSPQNTISEESLHLACAALFIEMMHMDDNVHKNEHETILKSICNNFSLSIKEANTLISLASEKHSQTTDYYQFTSLINKGFNQQQKITLIKTLWQIAYADGELDKHEEYLVRKMADLLHIPHLDFIKTKHQAIDG
ncbi:MAG: TerB family tellurite resistance protein [Methylomarinum sp.]|nr:TerB family tellurite resistance protein [Methylomarinum sp.]